MGCAEIKGLEFYKHGVPTALLTIYADAVSKMPQSPSGIHALLKFSAQPGAGHLPVAFDRGMAKTHYFCRFFNGKSAKKTQLHDSFLLRIELLQLFKRFV